MRLEQGDKVTATYLWPTNDGKWPDLVILRPSGDVDMSNPPQVSRGYCPAEEVNAEQDRLEKTILALIDYIEMDGELLSDTVPHFAKMLADMGLYEIAEVEE